MWKGFSNPSSRPLGGRYRCRERVREPVAHTDRAAGAQVRADADLGPSHSAAGFREGATGQNRRIVHCSERTLWLSTEAVNSTPPELKSSVSRRRVCVSSGLLL